MDRLDEIPYLSFPQEWQVKVIPNGHADARFLVKLPEMNYRLSVYLDFDNKLGSFNGAYWEVYPNLDNDINRYSIDDTKGLLDGIQEIFDHWKEENPKYFTPLYKTLNGE